MERLPEICTIIQNVLIVVIIILRIRCDRYFKLSEKYSRLVHTKSGNEQ